MFHESNIIVLVSLVTLGATVKLPPNFEKCNRHEPGLKECILKAAQNGIPQLNKPYDELNIPNADPLEVPEISVSTGAGNSALGQKFTDSKFYGLTQIKLDKFEFDFDKHTLDASGVFPEVRLAGNYEIDGKILVLPVKGNGPSTAVLRNVTVAVFFKYDEVKRRGKTYIKMVSCDIRALDPEFATFRFENLFGGDKTIGDNINQVLNENWKEVYEEFKKSYVQVIAEILLRLLNGFFSKVSMEEALD